MNDAMDRNIFTDLETDRLVLRNIAPEDAGFFFKVFSQPDVTRYLLDHEPFRSPEDAEMWIEWYLNAVPDHNRWIITNKETGERMGTCGFHMWDRRNNSVEIGYDLLPEYRGHGYMNEALRSALDFAFRTMDVNRICATIHPDNSRSIRLAENLGFRKEGILRDLLFADGRYHDHCLYALLQWEYAGRS